MADKVIEILEANLEKAESRFQALQLETDEMLNAIAIQIHSASAEKFSSADERMAEIRACVKHLTKVIA